MFLIVTYVCSIETCINIECPFPLHPFRCRMYFVCMPTISFANYLHVIFFSLSFKIYLSLELSLVDSIKLDHTFLFSLLISAFN